MASVSRSALVPYSADQMFSLVADVDAYQEFLPWCGESQILKREGDVVEGRIQISKAGFEKSFTTRNRMQPGKMVEIRLVEGPFRNLDGFWRFHSLGEGACKVTLDLDFEFSNRMLTLAFSKVFTQIANSLVDSFVQRAKQVYG